MATAIVEHLVVNRKHKHGNYKFNIFSGEITKNLRRKKQRELSYPVYEEWCHGCTRHQMNQEGIGVWWRRRFQIVPSKSSEHQVSMNRRKHTVYRYEQNNENYFKLL